MKLSNAALSLLSTFSAANAFAPHSSSRSGIVTQRSLAPLEFFDDPREVLPKTIELYEKLGLETTSVLAANEMEIFYKNAGEEFDFASFYQAYTSLIEGKVLTNFDDKFDFIDVMRWLNVFQRFPELQTMLKEEGMSKAILRSTEIINEIEGNRLKTALDTMSSYRDLLQVEVPEVLGGSEFYADATTDHSDAIDPDFDAAFSPLQMRCLALVSHNQMKGTMRKFVEANKNLLKKFRLTGTNSTMTMLREVFGDDPLVVYGPSCKSGPLGGDAELVAAMCKGELGGMLFFQDPMESHMHDVDIQCLNRQALIYNVMTAVNPTSAIMMTHTLRSALMEGKADYIPSFLFTLECPTVEMYSTQQKAVIQANIDEGALS